ncbi:MAG: hypothetical protein ACFB0Z_08855 [Candidatus Phaeomarinobacter sp.]
MAMHSGGQIDFQNKSSDNPIEIDLTSLSIKAGTIKLYGVGELSTNAQSDLIITLNGVKSGYTSDMKANDRRGNGHDRAYDVEGYLAGANYAKEGATFSFESNISIFATDPVAIAFGRAAYVYADGNTLHATWHGRMNKIQEIRSLQIYPSDGLISGRVEPVILA